VNAASILSVLKIILTLEPAAFGLVQSLVQGVAGKSDADILASDASDWTSIVATAHAAAQPPSAT